MFLHDVWQDETCKMSDKFCVCIVDIVADVGGRDDVVTFHHCISVNKSDFINHSSESNSYQHM